MSDLKKAALSAAEIQDLSLQLKKATEEMVFALCAASGEWAGEARDAFAQKAAVWGDKMTQDVGLLERSAERLKNAIGNPDEEE